MILLKIVKVTTNVLIRSPQHQVQCSEDHDRFSPEQQPTPKLAESYQVLGGWLIIYPPDCKIATMSAEDTLDT